LALNSIGSQRQDMSIPLFRDFSYRHHQDVQHTGFTYFKPTELIYWADSSAEFVRDALISDSVGALREAVHEWLFRPGNDRWLMIYDDWRGGHISEYEYNYREILYGSIIITIQQMHLLAYHSKLQFIETIKLGELEVPDSIELLLQVSGRERERTGKQCAC